MAKQRYKRSRVVVLEESESIEIRFFTPEMWPPMVIHFEDGGMRDRIDRKLEKSRTPTMLAELLQARAK